MSSYVAEFPAILNFLSISQVLTKGWLVWGSEEPQEWWAKTCEEVRLLNGHRQSPLVLQISQKVNKSIDNNSQSYGYLYGLLAAC